MKRIVSQEDLDLNPELAEEGVQVGDEIEFPGPGEEGSRDEGEGGPGGGQPGGPQPGKPEKEEPNEP